MRLRSNRISAEIGLALSLVILICAFSIDTGHDASGEANHQPDQPRAVINPVEIQQTTQVPETPLVVSTEPSQDQVEPDVIENTATTIEQTLPGLDYGGDTPVAFPEPPDFPEPEIGSDVEPEHPGFVYVAEVMPTLIGGLGSIQSAITYPELARRARVEGRVIVQFTVEKDGSVQEAQILSGIGSGCDEQALEAVLGATFTPGIQRGRPVRVRMSLPVTFTLH